MIDYINIEICYTKGSNRERQMDVYTYELFFKQATKVKNLKNMKNIIQIMIITMITLKRIDFVIR